MQASRPRERRQPVILALGVIGLALLVLPLLGLILRAPWGQLGELFVRQEVLQALGLSLLTSTLSTGLSLILGIPLAVLLSHSVHWKVLPRRLLRAAITIPLVLPPVVGGIALLLPGGDLRAGRIPALPDLEEGHLQFIREQHDALPEPRPHP